MSAAQARRVVSRAASAALAVLLGAGTVLLGSGAASAQAAPRELVCTVSLTTPTQPVTLQEGEQVQLVLVLPITGTRVNIGPVQPVTAGSTAISQPVSALVAGLIGLVNGSVCTAAVRVQAAATSALPLLPPVTVPPLLPLPSQTISVPIPGIGVTVAQPGASSSAPPADGGTGGPTQPPGGSPSTSNPPLVTPGAGTPGFRFAPGALPIYDFSRTPFGVGSRFGSLAAPAFRFGQQVPGYAPQFGILGADSAKDDVANAGRVQALPAGGPGSVALPVLLAVLMLSAVAGALVRTWVLRRAV